MLTALSISSGAWASSGHEAADTAAPAFNAGETIIHHVQDAHEIHIFDGFTIPLPVIIWSDAGLDVFMSSEFGHGTVSYLASSGNTYSLEHGAIHEASGAKIYDLSVTKNVAGLCLCLILMFWIFISASRGYRVNRHKAPKGIQAVIEPLIVFIRDEVAKPSIGEKHFLKFMPFLLTVFFFILICNFLGLIPFLGGMNVTGNIAVTMVLAVFTFVLTTLNAGRSYWMHIVAPPGVPLWLLPIMIPIEILGVFSKPIVLMLRLFANITAGHIIILSFTSLIFIFAESGGVAAGYGVSVVSVLFSVFMNTLELLVAFLQAYVFTLLSALYFGQAVEEHH